MNISETIKALPDDAECCVLRYGSDRIEAFADVPDLKRLVTALEKCEATAELFAGTLSPKAGGTIANDLLADIREALGK